MEYTHIKFQTSQERAIDHNPDGFVMQHVVNCCCFVKCCDSCKDKPKDYECKQCDKREGVFTGKSALDDFCQFLFSPANKDVYAFAHNFKGFLVSIV
jgi:hypothetical protein